MFIAALAAESQAQSISKSEIACNALATALQDFPAVVAYRLSRPRLSWDGSKPVSIMMSVTLLEQCQTAAERLDTSRDHIMRLALDYYFNCTLKNAVPKPD